VVWVHIISPHKFVNCFVLENGCLLFVYGFRHHFVLQLKRFASLSHDWQPHHLFLYQHFLLNCRIYAAGKPLPLTFCLLPNWLTLKVLPTPLSKYRNCAGMPWFCRELWRLFCCWSLHIADTKRYYGPQAFQILIWHLEHFHSPSFGEICHRCVTAIFVGILLLLFYERTFYSLNAVPAYLDSFSNCSLLFEMTLVSAIAAKIAYYW
jgi:hypothetical protein